MHGERAVAALKYETGGYVQDGLVAHYDGIRNAGALKAHDLYATNWVDLSATSDEVLLRDAVDVSHWCEDGYRFEGGTYFERLQTITLADKVTIQVVCDVDTNELNASGRSWPHLVGAGDGDKCNVYYGVGYNPHRLVFKNAGSGHTYTNTELWEGQYATATRDGDVKRLFQTGDGSGGATKTGAQGDIGTQTWRIGAAGSAVDTRNNNRLIGKIQAVRVYSRALTTEEIATNRAIDEVRFRTGLPVTNVVVATSMRGVEGTEAHGAYAVDVSHEFTAPATVTKGEDVYTCTGYTLEAWDSDADAWGEATTVDARTYTASEGAKVRLTWQWEHTYGPGMLDVYDYADGSLMMFFDGIRNAGRDVAHDPSATAWANLAGTVNDAAFVVGDTSSQWLDSGYYFGGTTYAQLVCQQSLGRFYTIQIVCDVDTCELHAIRQRDNTSLRWPHIIGAGASDCCNVYCHLDMGAQYNHPICFKDVTGTRPSLYSWQGRYVTAVRNGASYRAVQGSTLTGGASSTTASDKAEMNVGTQTWYIATGTSSASGAGIKNRYLTGTIHAIRLYDRVLSDEELAANRELDEARFWGRAAEKGMVIVSSRVKGLAGNEQNGAYKPAGYTFSAPAGVVTLGDKDYQADGYVVETWNPVAANWRNAETGSGLEWTSPAGADWASRRLTWKWKAVRGLKTYDTGDYVQEGLVLHLDGIRNRGADKPHDSFIQSWRDLSWRRSQAFFVPRMPDESEWLDTGYSFAGSNYVQTVDSFALGTNTTVEMLLDVDRTVQKNAYPTYFSGYANDACGIFTRGTGATLEWKADSFIGDGNWETAVRPKAYNWGGKNFTGVIDDTGSSFYEDGVLKASVGRTNYKLVGPTQWRLMCNAIDWSGDNAEEPIYNHQVTGTVYCTRLYNRALSPEEISWNRTVDKARYDGILPVTNVVVAAGEFDAVTEAPGVYEVEGTWTFTAADATVDGKTRRLVGYTLEECSDGEWGAATYHGGTSYTYTSGTSPSTVRLTWQWQDSGTCILVR